MPARRFPPPWSAEVTPNCFIVRDANGQALSYVYYESEPGRRSAAKLLSKDEARRIAANIANRNQWAAQRGVIAVSCHSSGVDSFRFAGSVFECCAGSPRLAMEIT